MKKFTKLLALVMALVFVVTAFSACGGTKTSAVKVIDIELTDENYAYDGTMWDWTNSDFWNEHTDFNRTFGEIPLFFGLRTFEGTIAETTDHAKENYKVAKDLLEAIITNTKPE